MGVHMSVPRPEEFILDVRRAARLEQKPAVITDSRKFKPDAIAQVLQGAALWLTPKIVEEYDPGDFSSWPEPLQRDLQKAVDSFMGVAKTVPPDKPATPEQFTQGLAAFRQLTSALRSIVLSDWQNAAEKLLAEAERWGKEQGWQIRREMKQLEETLLGEYQLQQLLFFPGQYLYVLDPIARFVPGALGSFDLALQPSYYTTSLYRNFDGRWYIPMDMAQGIEVAKGVPWDKQSFMASVEELRSLL
jgi:hypothetical protein